MKTLTHGWTFATCGAALWGALLIPPATAQELTELSLHDGIWEVATEPLSGPCDKRLEFKLSVEEGRISYAGMWSVEASGSVSPLGRIDIRVVRGDETVSARGVVRGDVAIGKWESPVKNCSGSFVARKA
ncbi:hypothetical protein KHC23_01395 [Ancylobacter dichloromethanicus]|uniref:DUF3617 family protein n=1 Tax=Ancylobacter dichloromethanicus TaxID=518825 RepID=A0A9W6N1C2_9HYPH|nr:hypothetical protein [Ancylobacter dichloromethanicus]MBS7552315.1 hypothetical protein [Ancylobacter dichloromethanicus]GLK74051.1 hypothetical protein GCM10017643_41690 [Ancylobacter dichloromethanicus]